ncbi:MAG: hypothetical protein E7610_08300 [Ruminococcaceae bacterium]|nr:hypothetical protein [Oscillospiraceae bacterium]
MKHYQKDFLQEIAFPLSGIGTGGISLSGIGALVDWELTGRPNKKSVNEYSHFAVKAERNGQVVDARVLQGDLTSHLIGDPYAAHHHSWGYGQGVNRTTLAGIAHFPDVTFTGRFPFAELKYACDSMPADIRLTAFNPFIPLDEDNSSLPAAFFEWEITNTSKEDTDYTVAFSVGNPFRTSEGGRDTFSREGNISSITLDCRSLTPDQPAYGELTLSTDSDDISYQEYWYRSGWFDDLTVFWREFSTCGPLKNRHYDDSNGYGKQDYGDMATLCAKVSLHPGETKRIRFLLTWYFPNFVKYWDAAGQTWKHEYCRRFADSASVTRYGYENWRVLYDRSVRFADALYSSTMPEACIEAAATNLSVLKSPTCLRLEQGEFWAFEGTNATSGSCEGTCDHVWNYQYALPFLFPGFARQILETSYRYSLRESGEMMFRTMIPLGEPMWKFRACVDGQMGSVLRFYREWKRSGDDEWLRRYWGTVKKTLEYAWSPDNHDLWDPHRTGVIRGRQHHTLDVELFGANAWLNGYYLAALKACAEMADYVGEADSAALYREIFQRGTETVEAELFNGRHYIQKIDVADKSVLDPFAERDPGIYNGYWNSEKNEIKYQFGEGCEIDQMVGQWHATLLGLGDIFDPSHRRIAARSLYDINFKSMREVFNPCRIFATNDERGVVICEWAEGVYKPMIPLPYTEECMTGFEYAAAGLMIQEGLLQEGVSIVEAIRDRYDGKKRNPFAEIECGSSYARSMASFALVPIFSGFVPNMPDKALRFSPIMDGDSRSIWSVDTAWGRFERVGNSTSLTICGGGLMLEALELPYYAEVDAVAVDGQAVEFDFADGRLYLKAFVENTATVVGRLAD